MNIGFPSFASTLHTTVEASIPPSANTKTPAASMSASTALPATLFS